MVWYSRFSSKSFNSRTLSILARRWRLISVLASLDCAQNETGLLAAFVELPTVAFLLVSFVLLLLFTVSLMITFSANAKSGPDTTMHVVNSPMASQERRTPLFVLWRSFLAAVADFIVIIWIKEDSELAILSTMAGIYIVLVCTSISRLLWWDTSRYCTILTALKQGLLDHVDQSMCFHFNGSIFERYRFKFKCRRNQSAQEWLPK